MGLKDKVSIVAGSRRGAGKLHALRKLEKEIAQCRRCQLCKYRKSNGYFPVPGEGSSSAKVVFIGEAPGSNEAKTGRPFCGASGKVLDKFLASVNLDRKKVYITSLLKDRPPGNRNPRPGEIKACAPYLDRQIKTIKPRVVCTLGNFATSYILNKYGLSDKATNIGNIHGKVIKANDFILLPLYHPAAAIYNRKLEAVLNKDFDLLRRVIDKGAGD